MKSFPELQKSLQHLDVLIVDDDEKVLEGIKSFVMKFFDHVDVASNGLNALERFDNQGGYDFIITDYKMPGMDGIELITELKKRESNAFIAIMSGSIDEIQEYKDEVDFLVLKPANIDTLLELLTSLDATRA